MAALKARPRKVGDFIAAVTARGQGMHDMLIHRLLILCLRERKASLLSGDSKRRPLLDSKAIDGDVFGRKGDGCGNAPL